MTANELITNLSNTALVGQKISDLTVAQNTTTLLTLLNMGKNKLAEDTLLWVSGEQVTMVANTYEYTLTNIPIQVVDVYDDKLNVRPRNKPDYLGYYQTSPNVFKFNSVQAGTVINVNYYDTPADYIITDEIVVPHTLLSALEFYISHKAFEIYKTDSAIFTSAEYLKKYKDAMADYKSTSDSSDVDTITSLDNKIWMRGIR